VSATDLAALIVAISSVVAVVLLAFVLVSISRTLKEVRVAIELLHTETLPILVDLGDTVRVANAELERVDGVLDDAESIAGTVDSASRLAYLAVSNPVIKGIALASGTTRAARALRRKRGE
jgi:uncharacterized protein YoxC